MKTFYTLVFCLLTTAFLHANVSHIQKDALVDLYNSTDGNNWKNTWDLTSPVSTLYGVTIINNQITELNLAFNNLNGSLPSSIEGLNKLTLLDLFFNSIEGKLPVEIFQLIQLETLKLYSNMFEGEFTSEVGLMQNLRVLEIYNNNFSG